MDITPVIYLACFAIGAVVVPSRGGAALAWLVTHHRWFVVMVFMMPLSVTVNTLWHIRNAVVFALARAAGAGLALHEARVQKVKDAVLAWRASGAKTRLTTSRPGWHTMSLRVGKYKETYTKIPVMHLTNIVRVDTERMVVHCEPMVTMGQVTQQLGALGFTLPVVPELDDLTVGGLVCGVGVESSSHRQGLFAHTCTMFELVTADGEVRRCTADDNPDLFRAVPWSHGTLGVLVGVEIRITPLKPWVRLEYRPVRGKEAAVAAFAAACESKADYVEALVFARDEWVVMTGVSVDAPGEGDEVNRIGRYWKPWFFTHVRSHLAAEGGGGGARVELVPTRDYYHRHTRSLFWEIQDIVPFGNAWWFRWTLGWAMPPNISIMKRLQTEELRRLYELHHVVQDMLIPLSTLSEGLDVMDKHFDVAPVWICPMRIFQEDRGFLKPCDDGEEMFVDVGAYGVPGSGSGRPGKTGFDAAASCRAVEDFVRSVGGFQMLYADCYQTRDEFRAMFDHTLLDKARAAVPGTAAAFPEVYDKVRKSSRH